MSKKFLFALIAMCSNNSFAAVDVSSICYIQFKHHASRLAILKFRTYFDNEVQEYIGGLVTYSKSISPISIVFTNEDSKKVPGMDVSEYRRNWLEIVDGKITGRYTEVGTDLGNQAGRSIDYINYRTQAVTSFSFSSDACTK